MYDRIKARIQKARQFAVEHQTIVACVGTGLITWKVSHDVTTRNIVKTTSEMMYSAGWQVGEMEVQRNILLDFVNSKELDDELGKFVYGLRSMQDS